MELGAINCKVLLLQTPLKNILNLCEIGPQTPLTDSGLNKPSYHHYGLLHLYMMKLKEGSHNLHFQLEGSEL